MIWQGSFTFSYTPADLRETVILWAVSTLIFLLMVTLAFMLVRAGVKLYIDRQRNKEGSRIRSKLFVGAFALALVPVFFFVFFSFYVLNRTLEKWFSQPVITVQTKLQQVDTEYREETRSRARAEADLVALMPETRNAADFGQVNAPYFEALCKSHRIQQLTFTGADGKTLVFCRNTMGLRRPVFQAEAPVMNRDFRVG